MARTITDPVAAASFARVIASDISLYHEAALVRGLREGRPFAGLDDELAEAKELFLQRVSPTLEPARLLVRTLAEFFERWAGERGLPRDGLPRALAARLTSGSLEPLALVVRAGLRPPGKVVPIGDGVLVVGRSPQADVQLDLDSVARRHTKLTVVGTRVEVEDMASHCGTYVNGEAVRGVATLAPGDVLQIGAVVFELVRA